jgi:hypothetical protein
MFYIMYLTGKAVPSFQILHAISMGLQCLSPDHPSCCCIIGLLYEGDRACQSWDYEPEVSLYVQ